MKHPPGYASLHSEVHMVFMYSADRPLVRLTGNVVLLITHLMMRVDGIGCMQWYDIISW